MRKLLLTAAACGAALYVALPASAGVSCGTDVTAQMASATVVDRGRNWSTADQPDLWEVTFANGDSVDLYATDDPDARTKAQAFLQGEVDSACAASAPVTTTTATTTAAPATSSTSTSTAPTGDQSGVASVTYVGDAWGPVPIWRVTYNDGNTVDVAATDADSALAAVTGTTTTTTATAPATTTTASTTTTTTSTTTVSAGQTFTAGTLTPPANDPQSPAAIMTLVR